MTQNPDQLDLEGARTEIGYLTMGRMLDAETIAELMEDGAVTWRPISEAVPVERQSIIVCTADKPPIVGEATWLREDDKELDLWWANTSPGDYYADPISQSNAKVVAFRPMPEAPCDERVKALAKGDSRDVTYIGLTDRLRASEAECARVRAEHAVAETAADEWAARFDEASALATSQAEIIKGLVDALNTARDYVTDENARSQYAMTKDDLSRIDAALASTRTPAGSDEARPDTGAVGGEGV